MATTELCTLAQIFNQKLFRIPDYQRGFSWQVQQLEDFWEDLTNLQGEKIHYTGMLTVKPMAKGCIDESDRWLCNDAGFTPYYVIDGQQRLTTVIIFIDQLLRKFDDDEPINSFQKNHWVSNFLYQEPYRSVYKSYIFGYEKDNPSDEYFKTKILRQKSSSSDKVAEDTLYTANLESAREFFEKKFKTCNKNDLQSLLRKLIKNLKFNFYELDEDMNEFVTFESMNNRGLQLSTLELLKNRLIYLTLLLDTDEPSKRNLRKDINETWKTIYAYLGKNKHVPIDDDDFLRNHWLMYFYYEKKKFPTAEKFLLSRTYTIKNIHNSEIKFDDIKKYIDSLGASVRHWYYLHNPADFGSGYASDTKEFLQKLSRIGMNAFPPLILAAMMKCAESELLEILQVAERFVFLVFRVTHRNSNTRRDALYRLAHSFYAGEKTNDEIVKRIRRMTDGETDGGNFVGRTNLYSFQDYVRDQFRRNQGYYSWDGLRYFLYEYELDLQAKANGNEKISWTVLNSRKKEETIEHVYPQTPTDESWKNAFVFKKNNKKLLHSLGNLVLLSASKNPALGNKPFKLKKKHKNKKGNEVGYFNGSYSEIEIASNNNWTPAEILDRGLKMLEFMEKRWNINFNEWEINKIELLQLDFLEKN